MSASYYSFITLLVLSIFSILCISSKLKSVWLKYALWIIGGGAILQTAVSIFVDLDYLNLIVLRIGYAPITIGHIYNWLVLGIVPLGLICLVGMLEKKRDKAIIGLSGVSLILLLVTFLFHLTDKPIR